jgi:serine O-acetyltransferase
MRLPNSLQEFFHRLDDETRIGKDSTPGRPDVAHLGELLFGLLFPGAHCRDAAEARYTRASRQFEKLLNPITANESQTKRLATGLFQKLPGIYDDLIHDAEAIYRFDPAARSIDEVVQGYPGFLAISIYRIAHQLLLEKIPLLPRFLAEYAHSRTGIDIHPGARIGRSFFVDHGTGIVIGETAIVGNDVKLYQGVTLGAIQVEKSHANRKRHPTIEDNCTIYANCTVLGGTTVIGHDSVIGGNTWITRSIPPNSLVMHQANIVVRPRQFNEPINFSI